MPKVKPYSIEQAVRLVEDGVARNRKRHEEWRLAEQLFEMGTIEDFAAVNALSTDAVGTLIQQQLGAAPEVVNMVLPHLTLIVSSVVERDPNMVIQPLVGGPEADDAALVAQHLLDYYWRRGKVTDKLRDATQDMVILGNGFLKIGWDYAETVHTRDEVHTGADTHALIAAARDHALANGDAHIAPLDTITDHVELTETVVERDEPFVSYVSPYDIVVPADARRMDETRWVAQRLRLPLDELQARADFQNKDTLVPEALTAYGQQGSHGSQPNRGEGFEDSDAANVFNECVIWEFYDLRTHTMVIWCDGADKPLFEGDIPYTFHGAPFVHLANYRTSGTDFWAFGELKNIGPLQMMLNEAVREQIANFRRSGQKYLIDEEVCTDEVEDAIMSDTPDLAIKIRRPDTNQPMSDFVVPVTRVPLSSDTYKVIDTTREFIGDILGMNDFQQGAGMTSHVSATAAAVADGVATQRAQDKLRAVERGASDTGNKMLRFCQEFLSPQTAMRIAGSKGSAVVHIDPETIAGEFDVSVENGSTQALNPAARQKQAMDQLNAFMPLINQLGYDPDPWLRHAMRAFDLDADSLLKKMPQNGPQGHVLESLSYKDAPPDVQRQIEQQAGLQPSQMGAQAAQMATQLLEAQQGLQGASGPAGGLPGLPGMPAPVPGAPAPTGAPTPTSAGAPAGGPQDNYTLPSAAQQNGGIAL